MKIILHRRNEGSAVIVVLALLAILLAYISFSVFTLDSLGRDLRILEKRQVRRLQSSVLATNSPSLTNAAPAFPAGSRP